MAKVYGFLIGEAIEQRILYIEKENERMSLASAPPYLRYRVIPEEFIRNIKDTILDKEINPKEIDRTIIDSIFESAKETQLFPLNEKASRLWRLINN